jgi:hypothetical protein
LYCETTSYSPNIKISIPLRRWPSVVIRGANKTDAGKKEDRTQDAVYHQAFDLPFGAAGIHKDDGKIDEPGNTEQGKDDSENTLYVHTNAFPIICKRSASVKGLETNLQFLTVKQYPAIEPLTLKPLNGQTVKGVQPRRKTGSVLS